MKKVKVIIGILVIILVLSGVAFGALYLKTDVLDFMKSPKEMFFKYAGKMFEELDDCDDEATQKGFSDKSYVTNTEVSWKLVDKYDKETQKELDLLNAFTFNVETKNDAKNKASSVQVDMRYDGESLLNLWCAYENSNPERLSFALPDILDESITIENRDLKKLAEMFEIDSSTIPDKIEFDTESLYDFEELLLTKDKISEIKDKYIDVIKGSIDEANFEREEATIKINGKETKTNAYTLTLSEKETLKVLTELLKELKGDDELIEYIVDVYNKIYEVYGPMLYTIDPYTSPSDMKIKKSDVKDLINMLIRELRYADTGSKDKLKITIYESKGEAVRLKLAVAESSLVIDKIVNKDEITISLSILEDKEVSMKIEYKELNNKDKEEITISIMSEDEEVEFTLRVAVYKDNTREEIEFIVDTPEVSISFNIENKREFKDVVIAKAKNTNILNDMTEEEIVEFMERFLEAITVYYEDNETINKLMELFEDITGMNALMNNAMNEAEIQAILMFNSKFEGYVGFQSASAVKALMTQVMSSNSYSDRYIDVYMDYVESTPQDIQSWVNSQKEYYVSFEYGYDGYIEAVLVEEE